MMVHSFVRPKPKQAQSQRSGALQGLLSKSVESGVPTFREAQTGLWAKYNPKQLATPQAFQLNPRLVWEWYAWRRDLVSRAKPNPGHLALAELEQQVPHLTLITQNVDGLHQKAGSRNVVELHGNISRTKCFEHEHMVNSWDETGELPPRCPKCNSYLRPDVVWFGESLPLQALTNAFAAVERCELFLSIGTSALVHPAASLPLRAIDQDITTVEINPDRTPLTPYVDFYLPGPSGQVLPQLVAMLYTDR